MPVVTIFSGTFCGAEAIVDHLVARTGYPLCTDETIVARASTLSGLPADRLSRCFTAKPSIFNPFTRERERFLSWIKLALAEMCQETQWVLHGFSSHLIPKAIRHVLRVCLIADRAHRIKASDGQRSGADQRIEVDDRLRAAWVLSIKGNSDPWDDVLYDMVLPTHTVDVQQAVDLIGQGLVAEALQPTDRSSQAAADFLKAARIETALAKMGHVVSVSVTSDQVQIQIDRPVLMLDRLETELREALAGLGIGGSMTVAVQPEANTSDSYRRYSDELPSKVLLVDDEREFVQTLSERLGMRDIGSAVAYDGESALELIQEDKPEVMLLDLQMPGIDGLEVLKRVKATNPEIEVVILTGHGTDVHREECLREGAFAYLEKPVDIEVLGDALKRANEKMRHNRAAKKRSFTD